MRLQEILATKKKKKDFQNERDQNDRNEGINKDAVSFFRKSSQQWCCKIYHICNND